MYEVFEVNDISLNLCLFVAMKLDSTFLWLLPWLSFLFFSSDWGANTYGYSFWICKSFSHCHGVLFFSLRFWYGGLYLQWIEEPTLLVTRFEYANLFHTVTDWYSAYVASRVTGLPNRPHLVFVDGHCTVCMHNPISFSQYYGSNGVFF